MYVVLCYTLYLADKQNEALYTVIYRPWKFTIYFLIQILGFIVGYFYAPAVIISTILATLVWVVPEKRAEQIIKKQNKEKPHELHSIDSKIFELTDMLVCFGT